jgi:hypothetical protein
VPMAGRGGRRQGERAALQSLVDDEVGQPLPVAAVRDRADASADGRLTY